MDILLDNFNDKFDLIIDSVRTCDFMTLDTEFSGLNVGFEDQANGFDQAEDLEMIYYLYIVDDDNHLRGLVSARQLVTAMRQPNTCLRDLMKTDLVTVKALDDQEEVADTVAKLNVIAIPVVDDEHHMLGIINQCAHCVTA